MRNIFRGAAILAISFIFVAATYAVEKHSPDGPEPGKGQFEHLSTVVIQDDPAILFSSLLDNMVVNGNGGWVKIGQDIVNLFLPTGAEGKIVLSDASGKEICHWPLAARSMRYNPPYQGFIVQNPKRIDGGSCDNMKLTYPGEYRFDFFTGGKRFYTFPITMHVLKPDNPVAGPQRYLVNGAWNEWGYLYYADADQNSSLAWKLWLREWEYQLKTRALEVELVRDSDKGVVAVNKVKTSSRFRHDWVKEEFPLFFPKGGPNAGAIFRAKDLLKTDGGYTLSLRMDGEVYGTWKIKVQKGELAYSGRTVRGSAPPETFIEGGIGAFWFKKE